MRGAIDRDWLALPRGPRRPSLDMRGLAAFDLKLRPITEADFPFLRTLHVELRAADFVLAPGGAAGRAALIEQQFQLQHRHFVKAYPRGDFWIVERADSAIGRFYIDRGKPDWHAIELGLHTAERGRGVGTALLRWLQERAAAAQAARLLLHVAVTNLAAVRLYERLGFVEVASDWSTHRRMVWLSPNAG